MLQLPKNHIKKPSMFYSIVYRRVAICLVAVFFALTIQAAGLSDTSDITPGYTDYAAMRLKLESIAQSPNAVLESLGQTHAGREIYLLKIGCGSLDQKPAVLVIGNVHAPYLRDSELAVRLAEKLVESNGKNKQAGSLLDRATFYIIPRPSPDAAEAFFQQPRYERTTNSRPVDDDNDGRVDEDGPDDLNGDGQITMMRVEDTSGTHMPHPDDPRVLIKANPRRGEHGRYRLYTEGKDNDGDGQINEDAPGGVRLNRNFTFGYNYFGREAGPNQVSEPESRAVADFAFAHPNIAAVIVFGREDNLAKPPKPTKKQGSSTRIKTSLLAKDASYLGHLSRRYQKIVGDDSPAGSVKEAGALHDWAYFHYGRWSLAARTWSIPKLGKPPKKDKQGADDINALRWLDEQKIEGFVDWKPIDHPDFPGRKVEVGGFVPFVRDNPPIEMLAPLVDQQYEFLREFVERLPRLAIDRIDVEPLGGGVHRVTVEVVNRGYLPTVSEMGSITGEPHPLQIELKLPKDVSMVNGTRRARLPQIAGGGAKATMQLLLRSVSRDPAKVDVRVWSPSVGQAVSQFTLQSIQTNTP